MLPRFDAGEVLRLVEAHGITRLFLVPAMARLLLDHGDIDRRELGSVRNISVGGAPASRELLAELDAAFGCETLCGYGLTEAGTTLPRRLAVTGPPPAPRPRATPRGHTPRTYPPGG